MSSRGIGLVCGALLTGTATPNLHDRDRDNDFQSPGARVQRSLDCRDQFRKWLS
jgi:hypothetical protein